MGEPGDKSQEHFSLLQHQYENALLSNETSVQRWEEYKKNLEEVSENVMLYSKNLKCPIMVPIGKKAFMKGNLVHTNECLVCLGDGWFVKQSAVQTKEFCGRRIKYCDEKLESLKKESDLLESRKSFPFETDAFAQENSEEIIEPFDEKAEAEWRTQHREKEKKYRQKLAEERKKNASKEMDEDVWKKLNKLELEEKWRPTMSDTDEPANSMDEEYLEDEDYSTDTLSDEFDEDYEKERNKDAPKKRNSVTFKLEEDKSSSEDENIIIKYNRTDINRSSKDSKNDEIDSKNLKKDSSSDSDPSSFKPKSILKKSSSYTSDDNIPSISTVKVAEVPQKKEDTEPMPLVFGDIIERGVTNTLGPLTSAPKPMSKFKASRKGVNQ